MISEQVKNIVLSYIEDLKRSEFPADRYYTRFLTWVKIEDNVATVGVDMPFVCLFSPLVEVIYPRLPVKVGVDTPCIWIRHRDGILSIRSPAKGSLFEVNEKILIEPDILNKDPYFNGWLFKIELDKDESLKCLMNHIEFSEFFNGKLNRLRDEVTRFLDRYCSDESVIQNGGMGIMTLKEMLGSKRYFTIAKAVFGL